MAEVIPNMAEFWESPDYSGDLTTYNKSINRGNDDMVEKDKELEDVRAFHNKFELLDGGRTPRHLTTRKLQERIECMEEELREFKDAVNYQDLAAMADALIDLVYFAKGTAVAMGLPWEALWNDVQRANMSKERGVGKRKHSVDVIKPAGWIAPDADKILVEHGYQASKFTKILIEFDESKCADDPEHLETVVVIEEE